MKKIYFDANAITFPDQRVKKFLNSLLDDPIANPSSVHSFGQKARLLLLEAREYAAKIVGADPSEVIFTSGATEAINIAVFSFAKELAPGEFLSTEIEHPALYEALKATGRKISYIPVTKSGAPSIESIEAAITPSTRALFFSSANSETGIKLDLASLSALASARSLPLFLDVTASIGKEPFKILPGISGVAFSGGKIHGLAGGGALIMKDGRVTPHSFGGPQENSRRAGSEPLLPILALGKACEALLADGISSAKLKALRDHFEGGMRKLFPEIEIHGEKEDRLPHVSNLYFPSIDGETLLFALDRLGIAASLGSACTSGAITPSRALLAMGYSQEHARASLRFSFSRENSLEEIDEALDRMKKSFLA